MANVDGLTDEVAGLNLGVWTSEELEKIRADLRICAVQKGKEDIYPLWKDLLRHWFSNKNSEVYIVTPFLDPKRLEDICSLMLKNRDTAKLKILYVRNQCHTVYPSGEKKNIEEVKIEALKVGKFSKADEKFINENVFPNIKTPEEYFHAKFIGSVIGEKAEVLVTSANFQNNHFGFNNRETVFYQNMTKQEFLNGMLAPIV